MAAIIILRQDARAYNNKTLTLFVINDGDVQRVVPEELCVDFVKCITKEDIRRSLEINYKRLNTIDRNSY